MKCRTIEYAQSGTVSINEGVRCYKILPTTLKDRLSGRVIHGAKMGASLIQPTKKKKELVEFLINCAKMGYGKTRKEVLNMVHTSGREDYTRVVGEILHRDSTS